MNNRSIALIGALLTSSLTYAGTMGNEALLMNHNGFYIAGDIGVAALADKESHDSSPESHQLGALGIIGGGYIGYDYFINHQYDVALEFFADATGLNAAITHDPNTYQRSQSYDIGVRLLPGYAFTPTTSGHVILGYTNAAFNVSDNGVYGYLDANYNVNGFQTGLGFTTQLKDNFSVRLDAIYDIYSSKTKAGAGLTAGTVQLYSNVFSTLAGEFSLIYKFS